MESSKIKTLYEKFKDEILFYEQHPPTHLEPLNDVYLLQILLNIHRQKENDVNNEIRNIVDACITLFDKLNLDASQSNELHELNYKLYKFAMDHNVNLDNKLFYDIKK
jgi:hypothetical protein